MDFRVKSFPKLKALPRPEDHLRALVDRAPEAEAFAERSAEKLRPALDWLFHSRRRLATAAVVVVTAWLSLHVLFGANGMVIYRQKRAEYQQLEKKLRDLQTENDSYNTRVKGLKNDPKMMEKEAREQLHYTRPGEVIYVAPAPAAPPPPKSAVTRK
jgi:cell division protein FtsB